MKVLVTVSCSKIFNVENAEKAERLFRTEVEQKLYPDEIHSVVCVDCSDAEE